ncbi:MAG: hypothetical protein ACRDE8_17560 [Ginsengibacter sp.]
MKDEKVHKKIDEVMHSIDNIRKASPRPFLFTRLEARMQKEKNIWANMASFVARPVIAFACICIIIVVNAVVIFSADSSKNSLAQQNSEFATVDEYSQVTTTLYDFENTKP